MGPVNWLAVLLAAIGAGLLAAIWFGPAFGRAKTRKVAPGKIAVRSRPEIVILVTGLLLLVTATMLGHLFARVGADALNARPHLYFMMSGGLAVAFVVPALWISFSHIRVATRVALIDAGYWIAAYLTMGLMFYLLG